MESLSLSQIGRVQLTPTAWANFPDINDVEPLNDQDYKVLDEIRQVLEKHGATNRFGVNLIHRHFDIADNEILLETTDHDRRIQVTKVHNLQEMEDTDTILETQWVFNGETETKCVVGCTYINYSHITDHEAIAG